MASMGMVVAFVKPRTGTTFFTCGGRNQHAYGNVPLAWVQHTCSAADLVMPVSSKFKRERLEVEPVQWIQRQREAKDLVYF
jgi:3-dehydroquinate dehydratase